MNTAFRRFARNLLRQWPRFGRGYGYFYQAMESWGPRLGDDSPCPSTLPDGSRVLCDLKDHVQRHMFFQGVYEPIEAYLFVRLLRPGCVVFDVGANVGQYTLLASSAVGEAGAVHSFEPVPRNFDRLKSHVELNGLRNAHLNRVAAWRESTELCFGRPSSEANDGSYTIGAAGEIRARAIRLDEYAVENKIDRLDVVKMDIEGAELGAIEGMIGLLERHRPLVLMEINRSACARVGYDPGKFWEVLVRPFGYTAWSIPHCSNEWQRLDSSDGVEQMNVLLTPAGLPASVASDWDFRRCIRWARQRIHSPRIA